MGSELAVPADLRHAERFVEMLLGEFVATRVPPEGSNLRYVKAARH